MHAEPESPSVGEIIVPAPSFDSGVEFFESHGFRIDQIFPADDPAIARMSGHGLHLRLERDETVAAPLLRLPAGLAEPHEVTGPNGTQLRFVSDSGEMAMPDLAPSFTLSLTGAADVWQVGRAGMHYRDLVPDRQGGRFIASHIRIVDGGPVPDYVHHHHIRFQMIFCHRGWVDVVYEDQGPPFRLHAGDCVLQPPHIRHRVLESSAGCEVVELGCPAVHETIADHELELPTGVLSPDRDFGGQRFVRHHLADAEYTADAQNFWRVRASGIGDATDGLASARVLDSPDGSTYQPAPSPDHEFHFLFVRAGSAQLMVEDQDPVQLGVDDSFVMPAGMEWSLHHVQADCELLEVALPARA